MSTFLSLGEVIQFYQKNKQTFSPPRVGEVSNLAGAACTINSKVYHSSTRFRFSIRIQCISRASSLILKIL